MIFLLCFCLPSIESFPSLLLMDLLAPLVWHWPLKPLFVQTSSVFLICLDLSFNIYQHENNICCNYGMLDGFPNKVFLKLYSLEHSLRNIKKYYISSNKKPFKLYILPHSEI